MRLVACLSVLCLLVGLWLSQGAALGRVLLALGQPGLAETVFDDPAWRGVAAYRAGAFGQASTAFGQAKDFYNLGNAHTLAGDYAAALESYDIAISQGHPKAQANFDLVAAFYAGLAIDADALALFNKRQQGPSVEGFVAQGDGRAAGTGTDATNTNTMLGLAELESRGRLGVRRVFDDKFMVADDRWLQQLADVPGEYLKARILQEYKRRQKLGLSPQQEVSE